MENMISVEEFDRRVAALMARPFFSGEYLDLFFPPGWLDLIERLVADLEALPGADALRCRQVKEKWGSLVLYLNTEDSLNEKLTDRAEALINDAGRTSSCLCRLCGQPGAHQDIGHITLCTHHAADREESRNVFDRYRKYFRGSLR